MQTKRQTVVEVLTGTFTGMLGSWLISLGWLHFSPYGAAVDATAITALCTVWSLVRGYVVRRCFNRAATPPAGGTGRDRHPAAPTLPAPGSIACSAALAAAILSYFFLIS